MSNFHVNVPVANSWLAYRSTDMSANNFLIFQGVCAGTGIRKFKFGPYFWIPSSETPKRNSKSPARYKWKSAANAANLFFQAPWAGMLAIVEGIRLPFSPKRDESRL
jgi:hypothetical protein